MSRPREVLTVRYERDGLMWKAHSRAAGKDLVVGGRTLEAARAAMAKAAARLLGTYDAAVGMHDDIALPDECTTAIAAAREARSAAADAAARSQALLRAAARSLVSEHNLSYRDAAFALGVSHARIQQVLGKE